MFTNAGFNGELSKHKPGVVVNLKGIQTTAQKTRGVKVASF